MSEGKTLRRQIEDLSSGLRRAERRIEVLELEVRRLRDNQKPTVAIGMSQPALDVMEMTSRFFGGSIPE